MKPNGPPPDFQMLHGHFTSCLKVAQKTLSNTGGCAKEMLYKVLEAHPSADLMNL